MLYAQKSLLHDGVCHLLSHLLLLLDIGVVFHLLRGDGSLIKGLLRHLLLERVAQFFLLSLHRQ